MKKILLAFIFLTFSIISLIYWVYSQTFPVNSNKEFKNFIIAKGSSALAVGNNLQKEGLIKNALVFRGYITISGKAKNIPSGEYRLSSSMNLFEIIRQFEKGPTEIWVTIPEGLRREEVGIKFKNALGKDDKFYEEFLELTKDKEGMLFPETYLFPKEVTSAQVVTKITRTYKEKTANLKNNSGLDDNQVLVLASLIERETKTDAERPIVAGIILNRLNADWPLQIDASNQYAKANAKCQIANAKCNYWEQLTREDLEIKSLFNTYKNTGLPPSPIANPGLSSLKAANSPEKSDYWFYIHAPNGQIYYAKTVEDHNANIRKYLGK